MTEINEAEASLKSLEAAGAETAAAIDQAFSRAGDSLSRSLARAAADGKISLGELAQALIAAVNAASGGKGGLPEAFAQVFSNVFSGARADGGFVAAGGAYLVGERGPEVFRPAVSGNVETSGGGAVNVTVVVPAGAQSLIRSEAQVATALQRAARMGLR